MGILDTVSDLGSSAISGAGSVGSSALNFAEDKLKQVASVGVGLGQAASDAASSGVKTLASGAGSVAEGAKQFAQGIGAKVQGIVGEGLKIAHDVMDDPGKVVDTVVGEARAKVVAARTTAKETVKGIEHSADLEVRDAAHSLGAFGGQIIRTVAGELAGGAENELSKLYLELQNGTSIARQAILVANSLAGPAGAMAQALAKSALLKVQHLGVLAIQGVAERLTERVNRISAKLIGRAATMASQIVAKVARISARVSAVAHGAANLVSGAISLANSMIQKVLQVVSAILPAGIVAKAQAAVAQFTAWTSEISAEGQKIAARVGQFAQDVLSTVQGITGGLLALFATVDLLAAEAAKAEIHELEEASESKLNSFMSRLIGRVQLKIGTFVARVQQHLISVYAKLSAFSGAIAFPAIQIILNVGKIIRGVGEVEASVVEGAADSAGESIGKKLDPGAAHPPVLGPLQRGLDAAKKEGADPAGHVPPGLGPVGKLLKQPGESAAKAGRQIANTVGRGVMQGVTIGMGILDTVGDLLGHPIDQAVSTGQRIAETVRPIVNQAIDGATGVATGIAQGIGNAVSSGVQAGANFIQGAAAGTQRLLDRVTHVGMAAQPGDGDLTGVFQPGNPLPKEGDVPRLHGASTPAVREAAIAGGAALFVNGINTKLSEHYSAAQRFANELNTPVVGVYNASAGMVQDLLQCVGDKLFDRTRNPAIATMTRLIRSYGDARQHNGGLRIFAHSQGSLIVSEALRQAQGAGADLRRNDVTTFGNATFTMPAGPQYHNYVHDDDLVSGLTGSGSMVSYAMNQTRIGRFLSRQALGPTEDVQSRTVTLHHGGGMIDPHSINSPDGHDYIGDYARFRAAEDRGETGTSSTHNTGAVGFALARGVGSGISDAVSSRYNNLDRTITGYTGSTGIPATMWGGINQGLRSVGGRIQNWGEGWGRARDASAPGAAPTGKPAPSAVPKLPIGFPLGPPGLPGISGLPNIPSLPNLPNIPGIPGSAPAPGLGLGGLQLPDLGKVFGGLGGGSLPFAPWMGPSTLPDPRVLQMKGGKSGAEDVDAGLLRRSLIGAAGPGSRLPGSVTGALAPHLDADVSEAHVHVGPEASSAAKDLGARAFTIGSDVFFGQGEFDPHSREGQSLLAHELTHVVQQTGRPEDKALLHTSHGGDQMEKEAQDTERSVLMSLGHPDVMRVESYHRTYEARGRLQHREQARLDHLSTVALNQAERLFRSRGIPNGTLLSVDVDVSIDLANMSDAEIVDTWAEAILTAVSEGITRTSVHRESMAIQRTPTQAPPGVQDPRQSFLEGLGEVKGVLLEAASIADTLLWADWMADHAGEQAETWTHRALDFFGVHTSPSTDATMHTAATYMQRAFGIVQTALPVPMGGIHRFLDQNPVITRYLTTKGLMDPSTHMLQISQALSGQLDEWAVWVSHQMDVDIDDRSSTGGLLSPYELGELEGAIGTQVALAAVGASEAQWAVNLTRALAAVGAVGGLRGVIDAMEGVYAHNPHPGPRDFLTHEVILAFLNFFVAIVGLSASMAARRLVQIVMALIFGAELGYEIAVFVDLLSRWHHEQDPTRKAQLQHQILPECKKVFAAVLAVVQHILSVSHQTPQAQDHARITAESQNAHPQSPGTVPPPPPDNQLPPAPATDPAHPGLPPPPHPGDAPTPPRPPGDTPPPPPPHPGDAPVDPHAPPSTPPADPNAPPTPATDPHATSTPAVAPGAPETPRPPAADAPPPPHPVEPSVHDQIRSGSWDDMINQARNNPDSIPPERQRALDDARNQMIRDSDPHVPGISAVDPGSIGFTSDHDITFRPDVPPRNAQEAARAIQESQRAARQFLDNLRERLGGLDPEVHLKTNAKAYQGHDVELPTNLAAPERARAQLTEDAGALAAVMRARMRGGDRGAWQEFTNRLLERAQPGPEAGPAEIAHAAEMRRQLEAQIASAEHMYTESHNMVEAEAARLRQAGRTANVEFEARQIVSERLLNELAAELAKGDNGANWQRVRELQAMSNLIDPEGYVSNQAMRSVVDSGQGIKGDPRRFIDPNNPENQLPIHNDPRTVADTSADNLGQFIQHVEHAPTTTGEALSQLDAAVKYAARIADAGQSVPHLDQGLLYVRKAGGPYNEALIAMVQRQFPGRPFSPELAHQYVMGQVRALEDFVIGQRIRAAALSDPLPPATTAPPSSATPAPQAAAGPPDPQSQPLPPPPPPGGDGGPPPPPPPPPGNGGPPSSGGRPQPQPDTPGNIERHADAPNSATADSAEQFAVREFADPPPGPGQEDNREARYFINSQLDANGILEIDVRTVSEDGSRRSSQLTGRALYDEVFQHFGSRIQGVNSDFTGTNLEVFNNRLQGSTITFEEAAMQTPSGRLLGEHGLVPRNITPTPNPPGPYTSIHIEWRRP